ncbi:hypothetical protein [Candidatus Magnetobacterium casense]|uniref:Terminase large subunit gp17-like C-terminal domain-containing protein n=1 Tax=Candidatus Magnetobacterium casense TaxID=1455061 RepID=A0ABS6S0Q8_9BACT|nr:hypothetical protein [Candidatus Magnetobacterium casensis]MBV6342440.1 hypothetical protein [Candidatus Magnetobacterium casensis]
MSGIGMPPEMQAVRNTRPRTPRELWTHVALYYKPVSTVRVCEGHDAPFDYIVGSFFDKKDMENWTQEERDRYGEPHEDCIVHACRSGGKTFEGGVSAHMKAQFQKNCGIRCLGGSGEQSKRMKEEVDYFDRGNFSDTVKGEVGTEKTRYRNGSSLKILMASEASVRGEHEQILMLDEVDVMREKIHSSAIGIAQSSEGVLCRIEELSTSHEANGLMQKRLNEAAISGKPIYRWCCFEILKQCAFPCTPEQPYEVCRKLVKYDQLNQPHVFSDVCRGRAKRSRGYYEIHDLWQKYRELSWERFACEYLCEMPKLEDAEYPMLSDTHLIKDWPVDQWGASSGWRLIMGADAGPTNSWVVWIVVGRWYPKDEFETAVVVKNLFSSRRTAASDFADRIVREHQAAGFPKAVALFTGPPSVPQDSYLAMELDKEYRRSVLFLPSPQEPIGRRCVRVVSEGRQYGSETICNMLVLRPDPNGNPRPALGFCEAAKETYRVLAGQQRKDDEAHGVAATRYALRGNELIGWRMASRSDPEMVVGVR